jgi:hypothetical protein
MGASSRRFPSVLGYNRLSGRVATPLGLGTTTIGSVPYPGGTGEAEVLLSDPKLDVDWTANVIDLKAQVSKSFLIIEPTSDWARPSGVPRPTRGLKSTVSATDSVSGTPVDLATLESLSGIQPQRAGGLPRKRCLHLLPPRLRRRLPQPGAPPFRPGRDVQPHLRFSRGNPRGAHPALTLQTPSDPEDPGGRRGTSHRGRRRCRRVGTAFRFSEEST